VEQRTRRGALVVAIASCVSCASGGVTHAARGVGPANLVVTSPVRTFEDAPYAAMERSDTQLSRRGGGPRLFVDDREPPGLFLARTRTRMEDLEARVREAVQHENLAVDAVVTVEARKRDVMTAARAAAEDGVITTHEKEQVSTLLRDAEREAAASVPIPRAWSGGPVYWR
jgi:hypothetical protein